MNKYQITVIWIMVLLLSFLSYPFLNVVFQFDKNAALISTLIISIVFIGITLLISLRNYKINNGNGFNYKQLLKTTLKFFAVVILIFVISSVLFFSVEYFSKKSHLQKIDLMNNYIDNVSWTFPNLKTSRANLWHSDDPKYFGFIKLNKISFTIENKGSVDISEITIVLNIYQDTETTKDETKDYIYKKWIYIPVSLSKKSTITIQKKLPDYNLIPRNFSWNFYIIGAKISTDFVKERNFDELKKIIYDDTTKIIWDNNKIKK